MSRATVLLEDLADLQAGYAFKSAFFTDNPHHVRLLRGDNVVQGGTRWDRSAHWATNDIDARYHLREGDVVLAMDRPWIEAGLKYATITKADLPAYLVQRVARLRAKPGTDQRYLHYLIGGRPFTEHILAVQTGTAVPHVSGSQILSFRTTQHSLEEQRDIATVLGALDDKIAINDTVIASAERLIIQLAGACNTRTRLSELARHSTASSSPQSFDTTVAHYSLPAFDENRMPRESSRESIKSSKFLLETPCVLISKLNPRIPRIWDVSELPEIPAVASTEFVVLVPREISTSVLWAVLSQPAVTTELQSLVAGTSGSHQRVKPAELLGLTIRDPRVLNEDELSRIGNLGRAIHARRSENRTLAEMRDELLPALMSGKVRVQDAEMVMEKMS